MYLCLFCSEQATDAIDVQGEMACFLMCAGCCAKIGLVLNMLGTSKWRFLGLEDIPTLPPAGVANLVYRDEPPNDGIPEGNDDDLLGDVEAFLRKNDKS